MNDTIKNSTVGVKKEDWGKRHPFLSFLLLIGIVGLIYGVIMMTTEAPTPTVEQSISTIRTVNFDQTFTIDSEEFEFINYKEVNIRPSYDDRSKVLGTLSQGDKISVTAYDSKNDYCKISKDEIKGRISCGWIEGILSELK